MLNDEQRQFAEDNIRLAQHISWKWHNKLPYLYYEDILSASYLGLVKAAKHFDPNKGIRFATFACRCMNNEVLMHLRKSKKHRHVVSLESIMRTDEDGSELLLEEIVGTPDNNFDQALISVVITLINDLPEKERYVITGTFFEEKTQKELSPTLEISQSYISRIAKKALERLHKQLKDD